MTWPFAIVVVSLLAFVGWLAWLNSRPTISDEHLQKLLRLVTELHALSNPTDKDRQ